jgi:hypothetical protein
MDSARTSTVFLIPVMSWLLASCVIATVPPPSAVSHFAPPPPSGVISSTKGALSGQKQQMAVFYSLNPDCSNHARPNISITKQPTNGTVLLEDSMGYPNFPKENIRSVCNARKVPVLSIAYVSNPGFVGNDNFNFELIDSNGNLKKYSNSVSVR